VSGNGLFGAIRAFFVYSGDEAGTGLTGVARYLQENIEPKPAEILPTEEPTGVDRYVYAIDQAIEQAIEQEDVADVKEDVVVESEAISEVQQTVAVTQESASSNGIFGAIRSFFVYTDESAGGQLTGVARYLQDSAEPEPEQPVAMERSEAVTGVARYLDDSMASEQHTLEDATASSAVEAEVQESEIETVQEQQLAVEDEPANEQLATGVVKYMQEQAVIESELPLVTGVEMYLQDQEVAAIVKSTSTGVDAYVDQANVEMEVAAIIAKYQQREQDEVTIEPLMVTGVASYIDTNIVNSEDRDGSTGVINYLERADKTAEAEAIIVAYLERQQALGEAEVPAPSSVASYIAEREQEYAENAADSGVTAYLGKEAIAADCADIIARFDERVRLANEQQEEALKPRQNRVSVVKIRHRQPSSVARYINKLDLETPATTAVSGVDKFMMEQELAAKEQEAAEIIARFEARQLELQEEQNDTSGVARYIEELAATAVVIGSESSVSKYLLSQPAIKVEIPVFETETSVAKYLDENIVVSEQPKATTGVAKYVANRLIEASQLPVETISGVDRYLLSQA
jgi:hypothetical protein